MYANIFRIQPMQVVCMTMLRQLPMDSAAGAGDWVPSGVTDQSSEGDCHQRAARCPVWGCHSIQQGYPIAERVMDRGLSFQVRQWTSVKNAGQLGLKKYQTCLP